MNTFEYYLSLVLGHTVLLESKGDEPIGTAYVLNGGDPYTSARGESTDEQMRSYIRNLPDLVNVTGANILPAEQALMDSRRAISPQQSQLELDLARQFLPQFTQVGLDQNRQQTLGQASNDLALLSGPGRDLARQAMAVQREADPEYFAGREQALGQLSRLFGSLDDPNAGLSPTERAEIDRSIAISNSQRGVEAPTATSAVQAAMQFGAARESRKADRQSRIANAVNVASGALPTFRSGIDTFQLTTGRPSVNTGLPNFSGVTQTGQMTQNMGSQLLGEVGSNVRMANQVNANRKSSLQNTLGAINSITSSVGNIAGMGCCWTFREFYGGEDNIPVDIRLSRDAFYTPARRKGYQLFSNFFVPRMRKNVAWKKFIEYALIRPMNSHASYLSGRGGIGWIFTPLQRIYLKLWECLGELDGKVAEEFR